LGDVLEISCPQFCAPAPEKDISAVAGSAKIKPAESIDALKAFNCTCLFNVKLRVDHGDIVEVDGIAIDEHLIQADNDFKIWKALPGGKEIAIRIETRLAYRRHRSSRLPVQALPCQP
jgi:hypothetical protein